MKRMLSCTAVALVAALCCFPAIAADGHDTRSQTEITAVDHSEASNATAVSVFEVQMPSIVERMDRFERADAAVKATGLVGYPSMAHRSGHRETGSDVGPSRDIGNDHALLLAAGIATAGAAAAIYQRLRISRNQSGLALSPSRSTAFDPGDKPIPC